MIGLWFAKPEVTPTLHTDGLLLRAPHRRDFEQWRKARFESRSFLQPFEPSWSAADLTLSIYQMRLQRSARLAREGKEFGFFIFDENSGELVGGITLSGIVRRAAEYGNIGYWMHKNFTGRGVMTKAVAATCDFAFHDLKLNRLNAACLPDNMASRRVLEKNRFHEEGFAERYLQINGVWRDHVLYGLTQERYGSRLMNNSSKA